MAKQNLKDVSKIGQPLKGISKDTSPQLQPDGTYRFALNAMNLNEEGNQGFVTNEEGNYFCFDLGGFTASLPWRVIGFIYTSDDVVILFLATDTSEASRIIELNTKTCDQKIFLTSECLDFQLSNPIQATYRIRNGCERNIYFTDDFNPPRQLNLDSLDQYLLPGMTYSSTVTGIWDCNQMKIFPESLVPCMSYLETLDSGGIDVKAGVYQFAVQYLDEDLNPTSWFDVTNPIPVYASNQNRSVRKRYDIQGSPTGTLTTKAIKWQISNLDPRYRYVRVAVLPSTSGTGELDGSAFIDETIVIPSTGASVEYLFRGFGNVEQEITIEEILVPKVSYRRAKTIEQLDNRLILGNVKTDYIDHAEAQKIAMRITTQYETTAKWTSDSDMMGNHYADNKTYMRDEVYAFGIVWVFNDGTESPTYHIPGRPQNFPTEQDRVNNTNQFSNLDPHNPIEQFGQANTLGTFHNREKVSAAANIQGWDNSEYSQTGNNLNQDTIQYNAEHLNVPANGLLERWKIYNTAIRAAKWWTGDRFMTRGHMSYWESESYNYPDISDCDGNPIYAIYDDSGNLISDFTGQPLRHHKMPDTTLESHYYGSGDRFSPYTADAGSPVYEPGCPNFARNSHRTVTLGARFTNIDVPPSFAGRVQGYKIVKADRAGEESILDKGIVFYNRQAWTYSQRWSWMGAQGNLCNGQDRPEDACWFWFQGNDMNKHRWSISTVWNEVMNFTFNAEPDDQEAHMVPSGCGRIGSSTSDDGRHTTCRRCEWPNLSNACIPWTRTYIRSPREGYPICDDLDNLSYHGPLPKFRPDIPITPSHIKFERIYQQDTSLWRHRDCREGNCRNGNNQRHAGYISTLVDYHNSRWPFHDVRNGLANSGLWFGTAINYPQPFSAGPNSGNMSFGFWEIDFEPWYNTCWGNRYRCSLTNRNIQAFASIQPGQRLEGFLDRPFDNCNSQDAFLLRFNTSLAGIPFPARDVSYPFFPNDNFHGDNVNDVTSGSKNVTAHYVSLKRENPAAYGSLHEVEYVEALVCMDRNFTNTGNSITSYCGDSFISKFSWRTTFHGNNCCEGGPSLGYADMAYQYSFFTRHSPYYMTESSINTYLRDGTGTGQAYYPFHFEGNAPLGSNLLNNYLDAERLRNAGSREGAYDGVWQKDEFVPTVRDNYYGYNLDYSKHNVEKRYFSLPPGFNFCTDCHSEFPSRIIYSEQSFKEERADHFRVFLANNYSDIPGNRGDIWNIFVSNNVLYAHTEESLWNLYKNQNQLQADETSIELGTGDFLSRPPRELTETSVGYAGSTSQWSMQATDYGTFWVDERGGRVFLLKENAVEISQLGLRNWFRENLPIGIYRQYKDLTGENFPLIDNPYAPHGAGIASTWDGEYKRYIITKKDYKIIRTDLVRNGTLVLNGSVWEENDNGNTIQINRIEDKPLLFEVRSWTMSYSPLAGGWTSWHSYIPDYFITSKTHFMSGFNSEPSNAGVWKHGLDFTKTNFHTFYNKAYPHMLEMVYTKEPLITDIYDSVNFVTEASQYDTTTDSWKDEELITFDTATLYNDYQLSHDISLVPKKVNIGNAMVNTIANTPNSILISRNERTWSFNNFRDRVSDKTTSLFTKKWISIQTVLSQYGYIDKLPNPQVTSNTVNWDKQQRFRDKYLIVRFNFSTFVNYRLITNYTFSQTSMSPR